jgi:hypothetical protein
MSLFEPKAAEAPETTSPEFEKLAEELKSLAIESTTPLDALNFVARWRENLQSR